MYQIERGLLPLKSKIQSLLAVIFSVITAAMVTISASAAGVGLIIAPTGESNLKTILIIVAAVAVVGLGAGIGIPRLRH